MLHVVTVVTESKYYFPYLLESCKDYGYDLEVLGYGEKWGGFNWRFKLIIDYLKTLPENDIVCVVDGYDVICCRDLKDLESVFLDINKKTGCKMIVSEEHHIRYFNKLTSKLFFGTYKNMFINVGTYIGFVSDLLDVLPNIYNLDRRDDADDQQLILRYCRNSTNEIYCDSENKLFLSIVNPLNEIDPYVDIQDGTLSYKGYHPFFVHAPFYGYLENILRKLGYHMDSNDIQNQLYNDFLEKKIWMYIVVFMKRYVVLLSIIVFVCIYFIIFHKPKLIIKNNM